MDERLDFPATGRNRDAIASVLNGRLTSGSTVLEVASGSGQHVAFFATRFPEVRFVPSDLDPAYRASIAAWSRDLPNVAAPLELDVLQAPWPVEGQVDAVFCANMIHIAPFACAEALLDNAARVVRTGGALWLYGPFFQHDVPTAPSNLEFDASLRRRDPSWGIRHLDDITARAESAGFGRTDVIAMPANNLFVAFARQSSVD